MKSRLITIKTEYITFVSFFGMFAVDWNVECIVSCPSPTRVVRCFDYCRTSIISFRFFSKCLSFKRTDASLPSVPQNSMMGLATGPSILSGASCYWFFSDKLTMSAVLLPCHHSDSSEYQRRTCEPTWWAVRICNLEFVLWEGTWLHLSCTTYFRQQLKAASRILESRYWVAECLQVDSAEKNRRRGLCYDLRRDYDSSMSFGLRLFLPSLLLSSAVAAMYRFIWCRRERMVEWITLRSLWPLHNEK